MSRINELLAKTSLGRRVLLDISGQVERDRRDAEERQRLASSIPPGAVSDYFRNRPLLREAARRAGVAGFEQPTQAEIDREARLEAVKKQTDALYVDLVKFKAEQLASQRASGDVSDLLEKTSLGRRVLAAKKG